MIQIPDAKFYLVGGSVRDELLGRKSKDRDYVVLTMLPFEALAAAMEEAGATIFFMTIRAQHGGEVFDMAYPRVDGDYEDGRRPSGVTLAQSLQEDAARRDFTINAMYKSVTGNFPGEIIDFFGGQRDLSARIIRAVGDPAERLAEDYLRILRAIRFAATLGFEIEQYTERAMVENAQGLYKVSADRIRDELNKALLADPVYTFNALRELAIKPRGFFGMLAEMGITLEATMRERPGRAT